MKIKKKFLRFDEINLKDIKVIQPCSLPSSHVTSPTSKYINFHVYKQPRHLAGFLKTHLIFETLIFLTELRNIINKTIITRTAKEFSTQKKEIQRFKQLNFNLELKSAFVGELYVLLNCLYMKRQQATRTKRNE